MKTLIAITEMRSMPGRYECVQQTEPSRRPHTSDAGRSPSEAAAYALSVALSRRGAYVIVASERVLAYIPPDARSRGES